MESFLRSLIVISILMPVLLTAQQRYLVSPNDEVIPLTKSQGAAVEIMKRMDAHHRNGQAVSADGCGSTFTFGYDLNSYPPRSNFGAYHKDVLGQWYVGKATGTIDTFFWYNYNQIGALDSIIIVSIHRSNIGPDYGPGSPETPWWRPPCQNWGYWPNSKDLDQGVAPFPEEAYPETAAWRSTINNAPGHPSTPPFLTSHWGDPTYPVKVHPNSVNFITLSGLNVCSVKLGEKFFVSMRVNSSNYHIGDDTRTEWFAWGDRVTATDENYPSRNWKFYEHDSGPSNCSGVPVQDVKRGWVARGGFGTDSLDVAAYNWWYVMTVASNTPPVISADSFPRTTFDTLPQTIRVCVIDCNPAHPESAGVLNVVIKWSLNDVPQPDIPLEPVGGGCYEGQIPGCPVGSTIIYWIVVTDLSGSQTSSPPHSYQVLSLRNQYYLVDTSYACTHKSIVGTGTVIDPAAFFVPPYPGHGTAPKDDGTAGPFELPRPMVFFGQESLRYAWIGVNGGIALSKNATDTVDVNSNGYYASYKFPTPSVHHYRSDWTNVSDGIDHPPPNVILPFWVDLIYGDTGGTQQFGHIRIGNYSDCEYVVEWDSLGNFDINGPQTDIDVFRVVLNHCDGTIEFQYDNAGTRGNDSSCTVGMQADSTDLTTGCGTIPYVMLNRNTYPYELKPRNNWCIKFWPGAAHYANDGWNLLSIPTIPYENDYQCGSLFPQAHPSGPCCDAYTYNKKYVLQCSLLPGNGFWIKFDCRAYAGVGGYPINDLTIPVTNGWNLIGTIFKPIVTGTIAKSSVMVKSNFFGYDGERYFGVDRTTGVLQPGYGYWVKVSGTGTLQMTAPSAEPKLTPPVDEFAQFNRIIVRDAAGHAQTLYLGEEGLLKDAIDMYELPPVAPAMGFDARFSSNRMVETYPATLDKKANYSYPISVQSNLYPITVEWNIVRPAEQKFLLTGSNGQLIGVMEGRNAVRITDPKTTTFSVRLGDANVPKVFALSENYPNPFNPTTVIRYQLPVKSWVTLKVFDVLGREVATLVDEVKQPGEYVETLHATSLPSGVYFYRLISAGFTDTKKMLLLR